MTSNFEIFENVVEIHQEDNQMDEKQEKMLEYIRELSDIEALMEPMKEQKRQLKADFKEAGWLTGDEISMTVKAYRMIKSESFDINTQDGNGEILMDLSDHSPPGSDPLVELMAETIESLAEQNKTLQQRVEELESKLANIKNHFWDVLR